MNALLVLLCVAGWVVAMVAVALLPAQIRRRELRRALRLRASVRPYLQRRALEAALDVPEAPAATADAIVDDICSLAAALTSHERVDLGTAETVNTLAVSDTQPMETPEPTAVTRDPTRR